MASIYDGRKLVPLVSKQNGFGFSLTARLATHKARQARADERALTPIVKSLQEAE
jgi:hypothetical protein